MESDWLRDYVQKTNAVANANRAKNDQESQERGEGRSDDDDDDDSEPGSTAGSKRNSLVLNADAVNAAFSNELSDKTPTANNLLSHAQASQPQRASAYHEASIRRHPQHGGGLDLQAHSPASATPASYMSPAQASLKVSQLPHFPSIDDAIGNGGNTPHNMAAREIWVNFQLHLDVLLECVRAFRFDQFEIKIRNFWSTLTGQHREIVHAPAIAGLMAKADAILYDVGVAVFSVDIVRRTNVFVLLLGNS